MSADLIDEIEAINSIYGPNTLTPTDDDASCVPLTYILQLPVDNPSSCPFPSAAPPSPSAASSTSLRTSFPESYPSSSGPIILGTHHSRGGVRGAGARDLELFRTVVGDVFRNGCVCLFDGLEEFQRRREQEVDDEGPDSAKGAGGGVCAPDSESAGGDVAGGNADTADEEPRWTVSEVVVENKSTFVARVACVSSPAQARHHVRHLLASERKVRGATHNITAWRIRSDAGVQFQDCDDDGETAAGARLLHLMQVMDAWGVVVVVSRWFGGVKLGPRRFALINAVARDGLVRAGVVEGGKRRK
ncbi:hypothetical protein E4U21_005055 [Claviceps maximensis]|nr:hypothetical protein E4U21_005055 [Claviceps maximensis]